MLLLEILLLQCVANSMRWKSFLTDGLSVREICWPDNIGIPAAENNALHREFSIIAICETMTKRNLVLLHSGLAAFYQALYE